MQQINLEQIAQNHYVQALENYRTKTNTSVSTENQTFWKLSVWILQFNEGHKKLQLSRKLIDFEVSSPLCNSSNGALFLGIRATIPCYELYLIRRIIKSIFFSLKNHHIAPKSSFLSNNSNSVTGVDLSNFKINYSKNSIWYLHFMSIVNLI